MKYLIDTRPFLLWDSDSSQLPQAVVAAIRSPENQIFVSLASMREIQIKSQLGMVDLPAPLIDIFVRQQDDNKITILSIGLNLTLMLTKLPNIHHDPFDRLIIAQALVDGMIIITNDPLIMQYDVETLWETHLAKTAD
jgi:PIN domain nuclease of toxin-antitoxin system